MTTLESISTANAGPVPAHEDRIKHLSAEARAAFHRFRANGDKTGLDPVVFGILEDFIPHHPVVPLANLPGTTRLIDDLGFDSLAIAEVVFFTEDIFQITITNEEIVRVHSLDDLCNFIHRKVRVSTLR